MNWLETAVSGVDTPWANRIKLTIDGSKIDGDLTDFPVLVHLGDSVGTNNRNVTDVFTTLSGFNNPTQVFYDNFSLGGVNWIHQAGSTNYSSNYMNQTSDGTYDDSNVHTYGRNWRAKFRFKNHGTGSANDQYFVYLCRSTSPDNFIQLYMRTYSSGDYYVRLLKSVNGTQTTLQLNQDYNYYNEAGNWFWVIVERNYDRLRFKIWKEGDSEPGWAYNVENVLDYNFPTTGYTRVYAAGTGGAGTGFDDYTITRYSESSKQIAITTNSGTQQYIEIEDWNFYTKEAWLWTKVPTISSGTNQTMYLYYDLDMPDNTSYVGDTDSAVATNVWNNNFVVVFHFNESSGNVKDSTSNSNDATTVSVSSRGQEGLNGLAYTFSRSSTDYISIPNTPSLDTGSNISVQATLKSSNVTDVTQTIATRWDGSNRGWQFDWKNSSNNLPYFWIGNNSVGATGDSPASQPSINDWHILHGVFDGSAIEYFVDNSSNGSTSRSNNFNNTPNSVAYIGGSGATSNNTDMTISEFRIYDGALSTSWVKADYYNNFDNLVNFGAPQAAPTFGFTGYTKVEGVAASRHVGLYRRSTMALVDETYSNASTGYFVLYTPYNDYHFAVILPELTDGYNLLPYDKIHPEN